MLRCFKEKLSHEQKTCSFELCIFFSNDNFITSNTFSILIYSSFYVCTTTIWKWFVVQLPTDCLFTQISQGFTHLRFCQTLNGKLLIHCTFECSFRCVLLLFDLKTRKNVVQWCIKCVAVKLPQKRDKIYHIFSRESSKTHAAVFSDVVNGRILHCVEHLYFNHIWTIWFRFPCNLFKI